MSFDSNTHRISTRSENVLRIADFYRRGTAKIDTPKYKAKRELAMMLEGELAGIRETMRALFGEAEWDRIQMVASNRAARRGENYLVLMQTYKDMGDDLPLIEDMSDYNMWGTKKKDVGEGFCPECEREVPLHYESCPLRRK
jgi:hypothetical protein